MTTITEAKEALGKGLRLLQAFEAADKALEVLEGLEQLEREGKARIEKMKDQSLSYAEEHSSWTSKIAGLKETSKKLLADAEAKAAEIINKGKAEAEKALAVVLADKDSAEKALQGIHDRITTEKLNLQQVLTQSDAATADLQKITDAKIHALKGLIV